MVGSCSGHQFPSSLGGWALRDREPRMLDNLVMAPRSRQPRLPDRVCQESDRSESPSCQGLMLLAFQTRLYWWFLLLYARQLTSWPLSRRQDNRAPTDEGTKRAESFYRGRSFSRRQRADAQAHGHHHKAHGGQTGYRGSARGRSPGPAAVFKSGPGAHGLEHAGHGRHRTHPTAGRFGAVPLPPHPHLHFAN